MRAIRTVSHDSGSLDLAYRPRVDAAAARFHFERVVLALDESVYKNPWDPFPAFNQLILGTGADEDGNSGNTYIIQITNRDLALPTPYIIVDGSALQGADFSGDAPFFGDAAIITTTHVTTANAHITTGGGNDSVSSGIGSDLIHTGAGDDFASIGSGTDTLYTGAGNDYIESTYGDFTAADRIYAGGGVDEISFYAQDIADADLVQVRSVELIGLSANGDMELDTEAQRVGIYEMFVDDSDHAITVGAGFTRTLTINMYGNFQNLVTIDASRSSATLIVNAGYAPADLVRDFHGGTGSEDTLVVSSGFSDLPVYGADLTKITGFEHIVVDGGYDVGGRVTLATQAGDIDAAFQTIDAHTLSIGSPLTLRAGAASAELHVTGSIGDDRLTTGSGDDRIEGGGGADLLAGRGGDDTFVFSAVTDSSGESIDTVKGFRSGHDVVDVTGLSDAGLQGHEIAFFGNQESGRGADRAFAGTAGDGVLDAVFRSDTHTLWFDTDDDGQLTDTDLHLVLTGATALTGADVLAGQMVI